MRTSAGIPSRLESIAAFGMPPRTRRVPIRAGLLILVLSLLSWPLLGSAPAVAAPTLAPGFSVRSMPSGQSERLTDFSFAPDGSYFTTGKNGRLAWVSATGTAKTLAELSVVTNRDSGLLGVAVAHDYPTSKTIYTTRSLSVNSQWVMRLSAWTVSGSPTPTSITNERRILELPGGPSGTHTMSTVLAPPDGTLWVSVGDNANFSRGTPDPLALRAQDLDQGYGKLLHILPNGNGVSANPYYDSARPTAWKSRVYASGFRSPFRFSIDPATGAPILGDVGYYSYEEVNIVRAGVNYGWPCWEGNSQPPEYKNFAVCRGVGNSSPLWVYPHGPLGTSVTGGTVYTGSSYPTAYRGSYFFGDYSSQRIYTLKYDATGKLTRTPEADGFGNEQGAPVKFGEAANGDIVYADIINSQLKRLVYAAGNRAPTARAIINNDSGSGTVTFDASTSTDLDGDTLRYAWDFGDGSTGSGVRTTHTYPSGTGRVSAELTVTDALGAKDTATYVVVPGNRTPDLTVTTPPAGTTFAVGEPVTLSAIATDADDGTLDVTWQVLLVHCSGGYCHDHPGDSGSGPTFTRPFDDHGDDTRMEISATVTDSDGAVTSKIYIANPRQRTLTVSSKIASAITVNGTARQSSEVTVGAQVTVIAPTKASDGVATFERWNDGAARERQITMPNNDLTLTAVYLTPIDRRYANESQLRSTVGTPTAAETGDSALRYRDYTRGRIYWSPRAGVHEIHGSILANYKAGGGHVALGEPTTDETTTPDGIGRYNKFYGTSATGIGSAGIYWSPRTGAHRVFGAIYDLWKSMGAEKSVHGYPTTDEAATATGGGRFNQFSNGAIYWRSSSGARSVFGAIYAKWKALGLSSGRLGFPLTNELRTSDGLGRYNDFQAGSIYWKSSIGARSVQGTIRNRWRALGAERSYLGYPTSDEFAISGGRRSNFERGYVTWNSSTGAVTDRRY